MTSINKAHREFYSPDLENGWEVPQGYPVGIEQKILSGSLDEANQTGSRTRLLAVQTGNLYNGAFQSQVLGGGVPSVG